jgi:hypothetical protein
LRAIGRVFDALDAVCRFASSLRFAATPVRLNSTPPRPSLPLGPWRSPRPQARRRVLLTRRAGTSPVQPANATGTSLASLGLLIGLRVLRHLMHRSGASIGTSPVDLAHFRLTSLASLGPLTFSGTQRRPLGPNKGAIDC